MNGSPEGLPSRPERSPLFGRRAPRRRAARWPLFPVIIAIPVVVAAALAVDWPGLRQKLLPDTGVQDVVEQEVAPVPAEAPPVPAEPPVQQEAGTPGDDVKGEQGSAPAAEQPREVAVAPAAPEPPEAVSPLPPPVEVPTQPEGHRTAVRWLAVSPDRRSILSASDDFSVKLWNSNGMKLIRDLGARSDMASKAIFLPDGARVLCGTADGKLILISVSDGSVLRVLSAEASGGIRQLSISRDGRLAASFHEMGDVVVWDTETWAVLRVMRGNHWSASAGAISQDGSRVVSGHLDGELKLWDVGSGRLIRSWRGHVQDILGMALTQDGRYAITGGADATIKLWDLDKGQEVRRFEGHSGTVYHIALSDDGAHVLSGSHDGTARLWDLATGRQIVTFAGHSGPVLAVAFASEGTVLTGGADRTIRAWRADSGEEVALAPAEPKSNQVDGAETPPANLFPLDPALVGPPPALLDGQAPAPAIEPPQPVEVAPAASEPPQTVAPLPPPVEVPTQPGGHHDAVVWLAVSPDGRTLLSASTDRMVKLWNISDMKLVRDFATLGDMARVALFLPGGARALTAGDDGEIALRSVPDGAILHVFSAKDHGGVRELALSRDGRLAVSIHEAGTVIVWDIDKRAVLHTMRGHDWPGSGGAISPDGSRAISGSIDGELKLWDVRNGRLIRNWLGHERGTYGAAFTPDGRYIVTGSGDMTIKLWDVATQQEVRRFVGHSGTVYDIAVSADGKRILSGSLDGTARLWDLATGREIVMFAGHSGPVYSVAFGPGDTVLTGGYDRTIRTWRIESGDQVAVIPGSPP